jgi:hypothetical protein
LPNIATLIAMSAAHRQIAVGGVRATVFMPR